MIRPLRTVLRQLARTPGFTLITVFTLALGIGANAAIFSVVHGVLIQPLPYLESDRLVTVEHATPGLGIEELPNSEATFLTYDGLARSIEGIGLVTEDVVNLTGLDRPERIDAARVTPSLFRVLRVEPELGPGFGKADGEAGAAPVVMISHATWQGRLGGDPQVLERTLRLDGVEHRVVGVLPEGFAFPEPETRVWVPLQIDASAPNDGNFNYDGVARLAAGSTVADAQRELTALLPRMVELYSDDISLEMLRNIGMTTLVHPLQEEAVGDVGEVLWVLLGTVGLILLIACANVANLVLVRAEGRQKEVAVRTALGAGRGRLARGFLGESLVLGVAGGVAGLLLALGAVRALVAFGPVSIPRLHEVGISPPVLAFTLAVSLLAGLLFGAVPMLRYGRGFRLTGALKEGGRGNSAGRERHLARNALVVTQVALALVLLTGSGLMLRSFQALREVDPGFRPDGLLTLQVALPEADYPQGREVAGRSLEILDRVAALPGVESVGAGTLPMARQGSMSAHTFEGQPTPEGGVPPVVRNVRVTPGYFEALDQRLVAGRTFERADLEQPRASVVVNETLARKFWPGQDPLGRRLQNGMPDAAESPEAWEQGWYTVVGVVEDSRFDGPAEEVPPMLYYPNGPTAVEGRGWFDRTLTLAVRTSGVHPLTLADPVRQVVWDLDPNLPVSNVREAREIVDEAMARTSFTLVLLLIAATVALLLGAVGLYGVIAYVVSLRTQEIGVRMALGAPAGEVARRVVAQGLAVAGIGAVIGLAAAFALTRLMTSLLFGVSPTDPLTFTGVSGALLATAALASWVPARRAAAVDPLVALRHE